MAIKPKKLLDWLELAVTHISAPELITFSINVAIFILSNTFMDNFYLWLVISICDIAMIITHGAYLDAKPNIEKGPWYTPAPFLMRLGSVVILFILLVERSDSALRTYAWYTLTFTAVCHAFYCVLMTLHATDDSWLAGTDGRIGTPNWISIGRMGLAVLIPHLFAVQPFGAISNTIATIIMALAIVTDAADGYLARRFNQITKAGKALDPLGDKINIHRLSRWFFLCGHSPLFLATRRTRKLARQLLAVMLFFLEN